MGSASYNEQKLAHTTTQTIIEILTELSQHDGGIRRRLACTTNPYPRHQEFKEKIANYTAAELAEALKRLSFRANPNHTSTGPNSSLHVRYTFIPSQRMHLS
jgi:hypothetical protein